MIPLLFLLLGCRADIQFPPDQWDDHCAAIRWDAGTPTLRVEVRVVPAPPLCWTADL